MEEQDKSQDSVWHTRKTLLQKIKDRGDNSAWTDFVYYYRGYVYNITRRIGLSHHDADEVVQIVMLKAWQTLPDFEYDSAKGRFRGWLCRVADNAAKKYFRDENRRLVAVDQQELESIASDLDRFTEPEIDRISEEEWQKYIPGLAWKNIQKEFEKSVIMCFERLKTGASAKEIAEALDLSENSVYVYKKRVLDRLKDEVRRLGEELG